MLIAIALVLYPLIVGAIAGTIIIKVLNNITKE